MKKPITRFAPSPSGFLHIGGARTALFNWAFAKANNGAFLLRIEDTDRKRSTQAAINAIIDGLDWLKLTPDAPPLFQHKQGGRHVEVVHQLIDAGRAYRCYCTPEDVAAMREAARTRGEPMRYDGRCRQRDSKPAPDTPFVIRFAAPQHGTTRIDDVVQGIVETDNHQLDDLILLRSDGSPTYMLSVVVDDHDMAVSHIIRGDDHLTNAARQAQIYDALGWAHPIFAHIPLIHGSDGKKLSKRHGALSVVEYRDMGILPSAMRNYLARLGWSHGDDEIFTTDELVAWFNLEAIGKSPARFDIDKLRHVNAQHLRMSDPAQLAAMIMTHAPQARAHRAQLIDAMPRLTEKIKKVEELYDISGFIYDYSPLDMSLEHKQILADLRPVIAAFSDWHRDAIEAHLRAYLDKSGLKLGDIAKPLRRALTGRDVSPGIFDVFAILGREVSLARLDAALSQ